MSVAQEAKEIMSREHYLYINMRDRGCNCGVRYHDVPRNREALEAAHAAHVASVSQTVPMTLTEFLLARIAEDETVGHALDDASDPLDWPEPDDPAVGLAGPVDGPSGYASIVIDPARVLAECEAKRRIVERFQQEWDDVPELGGPGEDWKAIALEEAVMILANVYADHPDFQDAWRI